MKKCSKCNNEYPKTLNYFYMHKPNIDNLTSQCKKCINQHKKEFYYANINKMQEKNKKQYLKHKEKYKEQRKIYHQEYYQKNRERKLKNNKKYMIEYRQTRKGKESHIKIETKRRRKLLWIKKCENIFSDDIEIEWHHINDNDVIALPKDLHRLYLGNNHRENIEYIVKQIYGDDDLLQI